LLSNKYYSKNITQLTVAKLIVVNHFSFMKEENVQILAPPSVELFMSGVCVCVLSARIQNYRKALILLLHLFVHSILNLTVFV
jgi:hypothetical protein